MNADTRKNLGFGITLFIAAILQAVYADALRIHSARPDFLCAAAILCSLFCNVDGGAAVGFTAGLLMAVLAAPPHAGYGSLIVSRVIACSIVGWLDNHVFRDNYLIAVLMSAAGTAAAGTLFFIFDPEIHFSHWAKSLLGTVGYNALIAIPLYAFIRRLITEPRTGSRR